LKREELVEKKKLSDLMDMYRGTLVKSKFIAKRFRPLHRKLKNLIQKEYNLPKSDQGVKDGAATFQGGAGQEEFGCVGPSCHKKEFQTQKVKKMKCLKEFQFWTVLVSCIFEILVKYDAYD
jgi:hypothetical protein